jgi:hypothetical protein
MCFCDVGSKTYHYYFLVSPLCSSGAWTHDLVISDQTCLMSSADKKPKNGGTQKIIGWSTTLKSSACTCFGSKPCSCHLLNVRGKESRLIPMSSDPNINICVYTNIYQYTWQYVLICLKQIYWILLEFINNSELKQCVQSNIFGLATIWCGLTLVSYNHEALKKRLPLKINPKIGVRAVVGDVGATKVFPLH